MLLLLLGLLFAFLFVFIFVLLVQDVWQKSVAKMKSDFLAEVKSLFALLLEKTPEQIWMYYFTSSLVFAMIFFFVIPGNIALRILAGAFGILFGRIGCKVLLNIMLTRELKNLNYQIPQMLSALTAVLKAGQNLDMAFASAEEELPKPISNILRYINQFRNLGGSLDQALEKISEMIEDPDFRIFTTAIIFQQQSGGNIIEIFERILYTITEKRKIEHKLSALTAQGKMQGIVLCLLPLAMGLILWVMDPDYMSILITDRTGNLLLVIAFFMEIIGAFVINKVLTIDI